jgi:1,4-alpha-glucan branching enzyme
MRELWWKYQRNLVAALGKFQESRAIEIITCAATHGLLPLMAAQPESIRAQILVGRDSYRSCFGRDPRGIWLPECAYVPEVEPALKEAGFAGSSRKRTAFCTRNRVPQYGIFAPILTESGIAVFGRDLDSATAGLEPARRVSRRSALSGFLQDVAFELDYEYLKPYFPAPQRRSPESNITRSPAEMRKAIYDPAAATDAARGHAEHFCAWTSRARARGGKDHGTAAMLLAPYDAELFGHLVV